MRMTTDKARLTEYLLAAGESVVEIQTALTRIPALGPENGGQGEMAKAELIEKFLANFGMRDICRLDSNDPRVESGKRPNIIARVPGMTSTTLWLFGHMDVVPPGDPEAWQSDPFCLRREGDLLFGRGVEDNQQAITAMLLLARALGDLAIRPRLGLGLVFMADEECGSSHGLGHVLRARPDLFSPEDLYIVPDSGSRSGMLVEVAEKAQLWLRFEVNGRQCHASTPQAGRNAFVAASDLVLALTDLAVLFPQTDPLFSPPVSTFTPTRHLENVPAINILPGKDVFYMDCRLLPGLAIDEVMAQARRICSETAERRGVDISVKIDHSQVASQTSVDSHCARALEEAIRAIYGSTPKPVGIGGATVAALLRARGLPAVVWSRILNTCHQPNECSSITATCQDAAVFAHILLMDQANAGNNL